MNLVGIKRVPRSPALFYEALLGNPTTEMAARTQDIPPGVTVKHTANGRVSLVMLQGKWHLLEIAGDIIIVIV